MKRGFRGVKILLLFSSIFIGSDGVLLQPAENAVVHGVVTDNADSRISGPTVVFSQAGEAKIVVGDRDGSYTTSLAPGKYSVEVKRPPFCELHRSAIFISPGAKIQLDLDLNVCGVEDPVVVPEFQTEQVVPSRLCRGGFCEEELDQMGSAQIRPFVIYHRREESDLGITYTGWQPANIYAPPQFTFDIFTLSARTLILGPRQKTVEGVGNVKWQDGHRTWRGQEISLSMVDGKIVVINRK